MSDELPLTPDEEEVERALRALRPAPSQFRQTVIALRATARRWPQGAAAAWRWSAAAAALLVACGAWILTHREMASDELVRQNGAGRANLVIAAETTTQPTLLAYRLALARSPAELDVLLDREGTSAGRQPTKSMGVLTLLNADLPHSLGDL